MEYWFNIKSFNRCDNAMTSKGILCFPRKSTNLVFIICDQNTYLQFYYKLVQIWMVRDIWKALVIMDFVLDADPSSREKKNNFAKSNELKQHKMAAILQTHFKCIFVIEKYGILCFPEFCSLGSIISDNGLVPNRWQAILWTNSDHVLWHLKASLGLNSLSPGRFQRNFRKVIFQLILVIDGCDISNEIALRWTSLDLSDDKSTLVQVMAWCRKATSDYVNQCWPRSMPSYGVTTSFWRHFHHWLHSELSFSQLPVQSVMKFSSQWSLFRFSVTRWH